MRATDEPLRSFLALIVTTRDEVFDAIDDSTSDAPSAASPLGSLLKSRSSDADAMKFFVDQYVYKLMANIEDLKVETGCDLLIRKDGASHIVADISDGLAGEFMTNEGFFARYSRFGRNAYEE